VLLVQLAWACVVPAFRGVDEVDHVYRAASVARGNWLPDYQAPADGRGDLIPVPEDIVLAAEPVCEFLKYNGPDNCHAVQDLGRGQVTVASAAARYNPVFYWVIGTPARPFDGATAVYVMRAVAALLCAALIATGAALTRRWSSSVWPSVALVAAITPIVTYSNTLAAPNGLELSAALLLWTALMGLATRPDPRLERHLLLAAGGASLVIATVRSLGPLWLALILLTGIWLVGRTELRGLFARNRVRVLLLGVATMAAVVGGAVWILLAHPNSPAADSSPFPGSAWTQLPWGIPLWVVQCIGAFPLRNEPAPVLVYAVFLTLWGALVLGGLRAGRYRGPITCVAASSLLIPVALTLKSFSQIGLAWQGRYGYPLAMGVLLLAGLAMDRSGALRNGRRVHVHLAFAMAAVACAYAQVAVRTIVLDADLHPAWVGPSWLAVLLTVAGYAALAVALAPPPGAPATTKPQPAD